MQDVANSALPEREFLLDVVGLRKRIQSLYDETRSLAQQCRWADHLSQAVLLLGCFQYLGWRQWISRILGRMAWSYIRLNEAGHAKRLLAFAESYDAWQGAANYYWASEYSWRANHDNWGREFTAEFRRICKDKLDLTGKADLELAVSFYEKLVEQEAEDSLFMETNNQSDLGRYLELRGRLHSSPQYFSDAALHYGLAGLHTYASFNRAFYFVCLAGQSNHAVKERVELYKSALREITGRPVFAEEEVKQLLQQYLRARIMCCQLLLDCEAIGQDPKIISNIEAGYKSIHGIVVGSSEEPQCKSMAEIAARFISLSRRRAWRRLMSFLGSLDAVVCETDISKAVELNDCLNGIQPFLPSLSFLAAKEEE